MSDRQKREGSPRQTVSPAKNIEGRESPLVPNSSAASNGLGLVLHGEHCDDGGAS
jgi:hypothetical protein